MTPSYRIFNALKYHKLICLLLYPVYILIGILRSIGILKRHYIIVGSSQGTAFNDNPKYFYLNFRKQENIAWVTLNQDVITRLESKNLNPCHLLSIRGLWACLNAKTFVLSHGTYDVSPIFMRGATVVQLWHGVPLKRIGFDAGDWTNKNRKKIFLSWIRRLIYQIYPHFHYTYCDYLINGGNSSRLASAFDISPDLILDLGFPKLLSFKPEFYIENKEILHNSTLEEIESYRKQGRKVVSYLPTHRKELNLELFENSNVKKLLGLLANQHDILFVVKSHFIALPPEMDSIILYEDVDPYPLLAISDALITDYSSVMYDYLFLNRPILLFAFDLDTYRSRVGFYSDYEKFAPGPIARSAEELLNQLLLELDNPMASQHKREACASEVFDSRLIGAGGVYHERLSTILDHS